MTTQFVTIVRPPGPLVYDYPIRGNVEPSSTSIPTGFLDAMVVRKNVFVEEQGCRLENEIDDDDARSWHWVVYASVSTKDGAEKQTEPSTGSEYERRKSLGGQVPVTTIRLVPPPHTPHPAPGSIDGLGGVKVETVDDCDRKTAMHDGKEMYVKLGRLATVKGYRGLGLARLITNAAVDWAAKNKKILDALPSDPVGRETVRRNRLEWKGLVLVHSQVSVVKFYESLGFAEDKELGTWNEEGIEHVGMWKRLEVSTDRPLSSYRS